MPDAEFQPQATDDLAYLYVGALQVLGLACFIILIAKVHRIPQARRRGLVEGWPIGWVDFGLFLWLIFLAVVVLGAGFDLILASLSDDLDDSDAWHNIAGGAGMQVGILAVFGYYLVARSEWFRPNRPNTRQISAWRSLAIGVFLFLASFPVILLTGYGWALVIEFLNQIGWSIPYEPQPVVEILSGETTVMVRIVLVLMATVSAPIVEELLFRGAIYRFLKGRLSTMSAVALSAALFAAVHFNFAGFAPLFVLGGFLCLSYEISGNLQTPILLHTIFNANSLILLSMLPEWLTG